MNFNPKLLPPTVYDAYKQGPIAWVYVIQVAIDVKITDLYLLTDIAFYLHNPSLNGRPLKSYEKDLISQWEGFRTLIKPILASSTKKLSSTGIAGIGKPSFHMFHSFDPQGNPINWWATNGETSKKGSNNNSGSSPKGYYHPYLVDPSNGNPLFIPY